jgi:hypothetical protein
VNFEQFTKAKRSELRALAKECFDESQDEAIPDDKRESLRQEAQFYMGEMDRRTGGRVARRDLILELVVILLIGGEILLAIKQGREQEGFMNRQNGILSSMQQSTSQTATVLSNLAVLTKAMGDNTLASSQTLVSLRATTEAMNKGVHDQISPLYDPSIALTYDSGLNRILLTNTGRTRLTVTTLKVNGRVANFAGMKVIAAGTNMYFEFAEEYKQYSSTLIKGSSLNIPIEAHLQNENRKRFVLNGNLSFVWENDKVTVHGQNMSVLPEL